jgi:hypothetical protein
MTARDLKHYRPGAFDPFEHNRIVRQRKQFRALAKLTERFFSTRRGRYIHGPIRRQP